MLPAAWCHACAPAELMSVGPSYRHPGKQHAASPPWSRSPIVWDGSQPLPYLRAELII